MTLKEQIPDLSEHAPPITAVTSGQLDEPGPFDRGSFEGDIFFGDRENTTRGTHRWARGAWERLPSDAEVLTDLLSEARAQRDELLRALQLILPLAKGYRPEGQSATARSTCNSWIAVAEEVLAKAEGHSPSSASPAVCEESRDEQSNGSLALQEGIGN